MFKNIINSCVRYCKESYEELAHKTSWPTRKELTHSAIVVLVASIIIAICVFCLDSVFQAVMKWIYGA